MKKRTNEETLSGLNEQLEALTQEVGSAREVLEDAVRDVSMEPEDDNLFFRLCEARKRWIAAKAARAGWGRRTFEPEQSAKD